MPHIPPPRPVTILVAEDEDAVRRFARYFLTAAGYAVLEADSGEAAVRAAEDHAGRLDLVVIDVLMPGLGGVAAAGRIAAGHPEAKVLFVSGDEGELPPGAAALGKPFRGPELLAAVRVLLGEG